MLAEVLSGLRPNQSRYDWFPILAEEKTRQDDHLKATGQYQKRIAEKVTRIMEALAAESDGREIQKVTMKRKS